MNGRPTARLALSLLTAGLLAQSQVAAAHEQGELFVRTGPTLVAPGNDSGAVTVNGAALPGTGVEADDAWALGVTLNYMLTEHFAVELLVATPFEHRISGKGLGIDRIGEVKQLPPTLSLQWYPRDGAARLQPYVGLGVNYFMSFAGETSGEFERALGRSDLEVHDAVGLAAQAGVDYAVTDHWSVSAALWYVDIATEATIRTQTPGFELIEVDLDVDPLAWMLGVSYRF